MSSENDHVNHPLALTDVDAIDVTTAAAVASVSETLVSGMGLAPDTNKLLTTGDSMHPTATMLTVEAEAAAVAAAVSVGTHALSEDTNSFDAINAAHQMIMPIGGANVVAKQLSDPMINFFNQAWLNNFDKLKEYKEKHGDCNVPSSYTEDYTLRDWVRKQRTEFRKVSTGAHSAMTKERMALLESIGFQWENPRKRKAPAPVVAGNANFFEERWNEMYNRLKRFKTKFGNTLVPTKYEADKQLGNWVCAQRTNHKQWKKGGYTSPKNIDRFAKLEEIGFCWDVSTADVVVRRASASSKTPRDKGKFLIKHTEKTQWLLMYRKLKTYKEAYGNCDVPADWNGDPSLSAWVNKQRENYATKDSVKKDRTAEQRTILLTSLGFRWDVKNVNEGPSSEGTSSDDKVKEVNEVVSGVNVTEV